MRNHYLIFWFLFFVHGVFAADEVSVSVMVGDSVTLHTDVSETQGAVKLQWKIKGENKFIAITDRETSETQVPGKDDERFSGRLNVNSTTGFLTITNLKTTDSRVYELQIKTRETTLKIFNVTVRDVVESVSVIEGDSVTLHTGVNVQGDAQIQWRFGDQDTIITHLKPHVNPRWSNIHLNNQTGDLTITNIQKSQIGEYDVEINTSSMILHRKFRNVPISDEMKTESVKKGESVTLRTGLIEIKGYDLTWKFENHLMAEINKETKRLSIYNISDGRFEGRLHTNENTGSLTIRDTRTTDSGDYCLNMSNSAFTLQRTIRVTVKDPSSSGAGSGLCGAGVSLVVWIVAVFLLQEV